MTLTAARRAGALKELRARRDWTQARLATEVKDLVAQRYGREISAPTRRSIIRWEQGEPIGSAEVRAVVDSMIESYGALDGPPEVVTPEAMSIEERVADLVSRMSVSEVPNDVVEGIGVEVHHLCAAYLVHPVREVLARSLRLYSRIDTLLREKTPSRRQGNEIDEGLGWLLLLIACLHNDLGDQRAAEMWRSHAAKHAAQIGNREILAWCFEMLSWFAVNDGEPTRAVRWAAAGQDLVRSSPVLPQLILKEANGHAQSHNPEMARNTLDRCAEIADGLVLDDLPRHHFRVDRLRISFFAMESHRWLGDDDRVIADGSAILEGLRRTGRGAPPPFRLETLLSLAIASTRRGEFEEARARLVTAAQVAGRQTAPSMQVCRSEILAALVAQNARQGEYRDFERLTRELIANNS